MEQNNGDPVSLSAFPLNWQLCMERAIHTSLENGLSGAVLHYGTAGGVLAQQAFGNQRRYDQTQLMPVPQVMREDTVFDLASLTKIFSTTLALHRLVDRGMLHIDDLVARFLPGFDTDEKGSIRLRDLLGHNSGFPPSFHFYDPAQSGPDMYSQDRYRTLQLLSRVPLVRPPRTKTAYSDLDFVTLGAIIEAVTGQRQDQFVRQEIYVPLGLHNTGYVPRQQGHVAQDCSATERCGNTRDGRVSFPNIRTYTLQGEVHDELCYYAMGQVSGHAGLFSTAADLGVLCRLLLNGGSLNAYTLCSPQTVALFRQTFNLDATYALG